jgi:hypothetical protein
MCYIPKKCHIGGGVAAAAAAVLTVGEGYEKSFLIFALDERGKNKKAKLPEQNFAFLCECVCLALAFNGAPALA